MVYRAVYPELTQGPRPKSRAVSCQHRGPRSEAQATIALCPMPRTKGRGPRTLVGERRERGRAQGLLELFAPAPRANGRPPYPLKRPPCALRPALVVGVAVFIVGIFVRGLGVHGPRSTVLGSICRGLGAWIQGRGLGWSACLTIDFA